MTDECFDGGELHKLGASMQGEAGRIAGRIEGCVGNCRHVSIARRACSWDQLQDATFKAFHESKVS